MRLGAYEEMEKQFAASASESDGCFRPFAQSPALFQKIVADTNVAAQEAGIRALCAFLEFGGPELCGRVYKQVLPSLLEKGLPATRAGTKEHAIKALLWLVELECTEDVLEEMAGMLSHKTPKVVAANAAGLYEIFHAFGAKTVPPKPIVAPVTKLFQHTDKNVRAEAAKVVVELYRWLGDAIAKVMLADLKPVQQKDLEEQFSKVKGETPHQERYTRSQQAAMQSGSGDAANGGGDASDPSDGAGDGDQGDSEDAAYDLAEAVDVSSKIPSNLAERIKSAKWKERKEVLEELEPAINVAKMENGDFSETLRLLATCIAKDANVQCVQLAATCVEHFGTGLRQAFARYVSTVLQPLLERTKEKKAAVAEALATALDAVFKTTTLSDILETVLEALGHKTPQVKIESAKFLVRCLKITPTYPKQNEFKEMAFYAVKLLNETQEPVRTAGAEVLGVMMRMMGERAMKEYIGDVDDIKKKKIHEFYESATVKAVAPVAKAAPAAKPAGGPRPGVRPGVKPMRPGAGAGAGAGTGAASSAGDAPQAKRPVARDINNLSSTPARAPPASRRRLASPVKSRLAPGPGAGAASTSAGSATTSRGPSPPSAEQPTSAIAPPTTPARAKGSSLASRTLNRQAPRAAPEPAPAMPDPLLAELETLRAEKAQWAEEKARMHWKEEEDKAERNRLLQEILELRRANADIQEKLTRCTLDLKSKETQLVRLSSERDTDRARVARLELELRQAQAQAQSQPQAQALPGPEVQSPPDDEEHQSPPTTSGLRTLNTARTAAAAPPGGYRRHTKSPSLTIQYGLDTRSSTATNAPSSQRPSSLVRPSEPRRTTQPLSATSAPEKENGAPTGKPAPRTTDYDWRRPRGDNMSANIHHRTDELLARIVAMKKLQKDA